MIQLLFFRQHFYNATPAAAHMHQQNTISCAKQESQPNRHQLKPIHFQQILSSMTMVASKPPPPQKKKKEEKKKHIHT